MEQVIELLENINQKLEQLNNKDKLPKLIYAKEIKENYRVNAAKAIALCKIYGTNFGGYCIEADKLKEVFQTKGTKLFD